MKPAADRRLELSWRISLLVLTLGIAWVAFRLVNPPYVHVTDLGRDLIGARAAIEGYSPYQRLGTIAQLVPGIDVPTYAESYWVVHTPFSVGAARVLWVTFREGAEAFAGAASIAAIALLMWYRPLRTGLSAPVRMLLAGALALCFGASIDVFWLQGASLLALALALSLTLAELGRRGLALAVLGVCVAWRPWCAPLALFMPRSETPIRDAGWVVATAGAATLASLPAIGGFSSLRDWVEVLPQNTAENLFFEWNSTFLARQSGATMSLVVLVVVCLLVATSRRLARAKTPTTASLAILALAPLVWPPHWVGLYPALLHGRSDQDATVLAVALVLLANPLVGFASVVWRVMSVLVVFLLLGWLIWRGAERPAVV
jgi:hypothetical protein